jgi:hypothetical protein
MTRRMLPLAIRWTTPVIAAALLVVTSAGCTQRSADDVERGAAPARRPLRPEPPVAAKPAIPSAPSTRPVDTSGHRVIVQLVGRDKVVVVTRGPAGPLYSATNRAGDLLVADCPLNELRDRAPEVYQFLFPSLVRHGSKAETVTEADLPEALAAR